MFRPTRLVSGTFRIGGWCFTAAVLACLGLSGCEGVNWRGDSYKRDPSLEMGQWRASSPKTEFSGFSNKARQIEKDLGAQ